MFWRRIWNHRSHCLVKSSIVIYALFDYFNNVRYSKQSIEPLGTEPLGGVGFLASSAMPASM